MKVIGFDLVGVLVSENSFELTEVQDKMERLFGKNKSDEEYKNLVKDNISNEIDIDDNVKNIIDNIYQLKFPSLFNQLKKEFPNLIIVIATNHVSYIRKFIENNFDMSLIDKIYISSEINEVKPDNKFYEHILKDQNIKPNDMLFLDDNKENIDSAKLLGIKTIKVYRETNIFVEIKNILENNN